MTLKEVSNNWNVSLKDSEIVLNKWLSTYKGDRRIVKEYLIRGTDLNGNCVISVCNGSIQIKFNASILSYCILLGCSRTEIGSVREPVSKVL